MKKLIVALVVFLSLSLLSKSQNLTDSLIVYYRFDGNVLDYSGNDLHGTSNGAVDTTDRFGNGNSALYFDGEDDFIDLPNNNLLKPPIPVSFSFWTNVMIIDTEKCKFLDTDFQNNNYSGCFMSASNEGTVILQFGSNWGGAGYQYRRSKFSEETINAQTWHHIVGVIRGATDMTIYIDGVDAGGYYDGIGSGTIGYSDTPGKLACIPPQTASLYIKYLWGSLDEFAMWNRALIQDDVDELFNNGILVNLGDQTNVDEINVYPNPANDYLIVSTNDEHGLINKIEINNIHGQIIKAVNIDDETNKRIDIHNLTSGIYYLKYHYNKGTFGTVKFLKK
ncbi:MAG: LamG-like jellyroll fold domain-containing protein [Bacteroidales bacterium]